MELVADDLRHVFRQDFDFDSAPIRASIVTGPHAVAHMKHYFGNTGTDYTIDFESVLQVPSAKELKNDELNMEQAFAETLQVGTWQITSEACLKAMRRRS